MREFCSRFRGLPLYIYGPEGCGKTRLLKEFVKRFSTYFSEDSIAVYVDALEDQDIRIALLTSAKLELAEIAFSAVQDLVRAGVPLGVALARSISLLFDKLAEKVYEKRLEGKRILIVVDDVVRAIGISEIERYVKWLYELLWKLAEEYRPESINFIVTTSEGASLELVCKHRHAGLVLMWNLDKKAFEELFYELQPPENIDFEHVWKLLGGNPGKLIEVAEYYEWNLERWFSDLLNKLRPVAAEIVRRGLVNELRELIEDPDNVWYKARMEMGELYKLLVEGNLFMYRGISTIGETSVPKDVELGIGEYYAWQIPAYREALRRLIRMF